jgi:hypothetical protein
MSKHNPEMRILEAVTLMRIQNSDTMQETHQHLIAYKNTVTKDSDLAVCALIEERDRLSAQIDVLMRDTIQRFQLFVQEVAPTLFEENRDEADLIRWRVLAHEAVARTRNERDTARDCVAKLLATGGEYFTASEIVLHDQEPSETDLFNQIIARDKFQQVLKEVRGSIE